VTPGSTHRRVDALPRACVHSAVRASWPSNWGSAMGTDSSGRSSNPLFNDNRMKLGTFCTNCSLGTVATTAEGTLQLTWANTKALAQGADRAGFEALVPVGRWKGFGGLTDFNGDSFEVYTWAAGLAEATSY